jgi:diguanylate cyclase (GGDEF)-like protein
MDIFHKQAYISYVQESKAELLSFLVIDIDKFKQINDQFGHPVGDKVIAAVVKAIKQCIRKDDFVGRIGGDEFSVALVNCDKACCFAIVNRILAQIPQVTAPIVDFGVTVSIGAVAEQNRQERDFLRMYQGADEALYLAKNNGGNNFCFYEDGAFKN